MHLGILPIILGLFFKNELQIQLVLFNRNNIDIHVGHGSYFIISKDVVFVNNSQGEHPQTRSKGVDWNWWFLTNE